jgi:hypothetical protein
MIKMGLGPTTLGWFNCFIIEDLCNRYPYGCPLNVQK